MREEFCLVKWVGATVLGGSRASMKLESIRLEAGYGVAGDKHHALTLPLDARLETMFREFGALKHSTQLFNWRQASVVSVADISAIQSALELSECFPYGLLSENIVVDYPHEWFSQLPPGSILVFTNGRKQMTSALLVTSENHPCGYPGKTIADHFGQPELASKFVAAAKGRRGLVAIVLCPGVVKPGQRMYVRPLETS
ncbi:MAG: MOSC domain-containing protein [Candidatus Doudnabacteria bacterium]|nr:MOSC domain-containing protein [Candidatus Doudnabacteria bacterium]